MGRSVQGIQAAQVRVFAHDAVDLTPGGTLNTSTISGTESRGVCLYIGQDLDKIVVTMESGSSGIEFLDLKAGSFLPILVTKVESATPKTGSLVASAILALY